MRWIAAIVGLQQKMVLFLFVAVQWRFALLFVVAVGRQICVNIFDELNDSLASQLVLNVYGKRKFFCIRLENVIGTDAI